MKKLLHIVLPILLLSSQCLIADSCDWLREAQEEMNDMHRTGEGCEDGVFNAISSSMIGWGIGLFAGIALLTGLIHNSHLESTTPSNNTNNN